MPDLEVIAEVAYHRLRTRTWTKIKTGM